jgi:hypothetical protein
MLPVIAGKVMQQYKSILCLSAFAVHNFCKLRFFLFSQQWGYVVKRLLTSVISFENWLYTFSQKFD